LLPPLESLEEQPPCFRLSPWLDRHAHPEARTFIRTEYALEVLDGEGGLFPPQRIAQMQGDHPRLHRAEPGTRYAGLLDVAGEEEEGSGPEAFDNASRRDSTALTIVEVLAETGGRELPLYRVVDRMAWTGTKHTALHEQLVDLALTVWKLSALVVDATGVGAGLSSFLANQLGKGPRRVIVEPFVFSGKSKSDLGWSFVGLIDGGRIKVYADDGTDITRIYRHQLAACTYEVLPGPFGMAGHRSALQNRTASLHGRSERCDKKRTALGYLAFGTGPNNASVLSRLMTRGAFGRTIGRNRRR
jgi:hypothetical protein